MTTNNFDPEISNSNLNSAQYYIDDDGGFKFISPYLSSSNFDGTIPVVEDTINAEDLKPGMLMLLGDQNYYAVVSVSYDDIDLEDTPSTNITVGYIDDNNELTAAVYDFTDQVDVRYEDWDNKDLGGQGWTITSGGNAIFANVGVRGDLEATTLDVGGDAGITYDGTSVIIGASVVINAPVTFNGSGSFVTFNDLSASYALQSFVDEINNRLSASIDWLNIDVNSLSASIDFLYNAGFVTDSDLVTTGGTTINGNNITTGVINANLVNINSGPLTGLRGVKINSLGIFAYNSASVQTFNVNSQTGNVLINGGTLTITSGSNIDGYATDGELGSASGVLNTTVINVNQRLSASIGTLNINANTLTASMNFLYNAGFVTDSDLVTTGGTTINGNNITTGVINANLVNVSSGLTGNRGVKINSLGLFAYDSGSNPTFSIDSNTGNLTAKGTIQAISGYFGDPTYGITIGNNGSQVGLETTTLKFGSQNVSGYRFGAINFYTQEGVSLGSLSATNGNKAWFSSFGNGLGWGTSSDYILLPSSDNTTARARYVGNGFNWYGADGSTLIMSIAGGTGGLRIQNNTGGIRVSGGGNIEIIAGSGGRFVGDGSGLTNLPGGGGGGGGVTEIKFGDNQLWRSGRVYISSGSVISAIDPGAIGNGKLANSSITIGSVNPATVSLGGTLTSGTIDGDVIRIDSITPNKIDNDFNLFTVGATGVKRGDSVSNISGPLTIGSLTVSTSLDYATNLGTSSIPLNRASGPLTLNGVRTASATVANTLRNLPQIEGLSGQGVMIHALGGLVNALNYTVTEANRFLQVNGTGTALQWAAGLTNPMTTAGDIIYGGASGAPARLPATTTNGQFLQYNTATNQPQWVTFTSLANPMNAAGQMIYGGTSGTPTAVAAGTSGQFLRSGGTGAPTWTSNLFTLGSGTVTAGGTVTALNGISSISTNTIAINTSGGLTGAAVRDNTATNTANVWVTGAAGTGALGRSTSSTQKIKKDIEPLSSSFSILNVQTFQFKYKEDCLSDLDNRFDKIVPGFIAEQMYEVLPIAVDLDENKEPENWNVRFIVPVMVKTIQDQQKIIDSLENKLSILEARLDSAGL